MKGTFSRVDEGLRGLILPLGATGRNTRLPYTGQEGIKEGWVLKAVRSQTSKTESDSLGHELII